MKDFKWNFVFNPHYDVPFTHTDIHRQSIVKDIYMLLTNPALD